MTPFEVFQAALELATPQEQDAFVHSQEDEVLRTEVRSLLDAHRRPRGFLDGSDTRMHLHPDSGLSFRSNNMSGVETESAIARLRNLLGASPDPNAFGLLGHYSLLEIVGIGGYGIVLRAFDERLHRMVAIKVLIPQPGSSSAPHNRFLEEARSVAAIKHENVVQVHSVEESPIPYIVMEYIHGPTLHDYLNQESPLDIAVLVNLSRQIASGLAASHERGFVHRDIKPGNILVEKGSDLRIKLTDFGLAQALDDSTNSNSGDFIGTPSYSSPEQARSIEIDSRSDLFSLGSVMYQMASGQPPFRAKSTHDVLQRVLHDTPRPIQEFQPSVPEWFSHVVERLHAKNPEQRLQSASELAKLLSECERDIENAPRIVEKSGLFAHSRLAATNLDELSNDSSINERYRFWGWAAITGLMVALIAMVITQIGQQDVSNSHANRSNPLPAIESSDQPSDMDGEPSRNRSDVSRLPTWSLPKDAPAPLIIPTNAEKAKQIQAQWATFLQQPTIKSTMIGMDFALVPPGEFDKTYTRNRDGDIHPSMPTFRYRLTEPYRLSTTEVTVSQFKAFVDETHYKTDAERLGFACAYTGFLERNVNWRKVGQEMRPNLPVTMVTEADAIVFCEWLSKKEGRQFRLPTEAEWIHACRAGADTRYGYGADSRSLEFAAWTAENSGLAPNPVGKLAPNPLGLYDMLGNLWERTVDWMEHHAALPYLQQVNPRGTPVSNTIGGCFIEARQSVHADLIVGNWSTPSASIGFRVAEEIDVTKESTWLKSCALLSEGRPMSDTALTTKPTKIDGLISWTLCLAGIQSSQPTTPAWNASTKQWLVGGNDGGVTVLDKDGRFSETLFGPCNTSEVKVSTDGKWVVVKDSNGSMVEHLYVWHWPDRKLAAVLPIDGRFWSISPDSSKIVFAKQNRGPWNNWGAYEFNLNSGLTRSLMTPRMVDSFAWTARADRIVCQTRTDQVPSLEVFEYPSMQSVCSIPSHRINELSISPDGKRLAIPDPTGQLIRIRELDSLRETGAIAVDGNGASPTCQWYSDSERLFITGASSHTAVRASTGEEIFRLQTTSTLCHPPILYDEAGLILVAYPHESVLTFDAQSGRQVGEWETLKMGASSVAILSDKRAYLSSGRRIRSFDLSLDGSVDDRQWQPEPWGIASKSTTIAAINGDQLLQLNLQSSSESFATATWLGTTTLESLEYSNDGKKLACLVRESGGQKRVRIIDTKAGELACELAIGEADFAILEWSSDDNYIAGLVNRLGDSLELSVWDATTGQLATTSTMPARMPVGQITDPQFRHIQKDNSFQFALGVSLIQFEWESRTWKEQPACKLPVLGWAIWQSPNQSQQMISYGSRFHHLFDSASRRFVGEFQCPHSKVTWSPDGATILFHQPNGTMMTYDASSMNHEATLVPFLREHHWLACSPDGHYRGSDGVESLVVFVAMHDDGSQKTYTPAEFSSHFGWQNTPESVALMATK